MLFDLDGDPRDNEDIPADRGGIVERLSKRIEDECRMRRT